MLANAKTRSFFSTSYNCDDAVGFCEGESTEACLSKAAEARSDAWLRGNLLNELSAGRDWDVILKEGQISLSNAVSGEAELLGLYPLV